MPQGITRSEIMAQIPLLKDGSFKNYLLQAGIKIIDKRPQKMRPHLSEYVYEPDAVERIKAVMPHYKKEVI